MTYSLLELEGKEFKQVNKYLEQLLEDIQEEEIGEELQQEQLEREQESK